MYLISNQEGYTFGLSKQDVMAQTGIKERSYTTAIQLLIDKNYLVYANQFVIDSIEQGPSIYLSRATGCKNCLIPLANFA